jgi:uncharacterized protein (DUF1330 family)
MRTGMTAAVALGLAALGAATAAWAEAYVVNEIEVSDAAAFKTYAEKTPATLAPFGGKFVVRGGNGAAIAGAPPSPRIVILSFPDREKALAWRASPAYQAILPIREKSSTSRVYVVDGVAP